MKTLIVNLMFASLMIFPAVVNAQLTNGDDVFGREESNGVLSKGDDGLSTGEEAPVPTDAPIDGGLSILLIAGAAYGVKRATAKKQIA